MKRTLDPSRLVKRRIELELSARQVARSIGVSSNVVDRLERTGEIGHLLISVVLSYLEAIQLDLAEELMVTGQSAYRRDDRLERIGASLASRAERVTETDLAAELALPLTEVSELLDHLHEQLRPAGIGLHRAHADGVKLVPLMVQPSPAADEDVDQKQLQALANINKASLQLLKRIVDGDTGMRRIATATSGTGFIALTTLVAAGLVEMADGQHAKPTELAMKLVGLGQQLPKPGTPSVPDLDDDEVLETVEDDWGSGYEPFDHVVRKPGRYPKSRTGSLVEPRPWRERSYV